MKKVLLILTVLSLFFISYVFAAVTEYNIRVNPDTTYTFTAGDFSTVFDEIDVGEISSVVITTLPTDTAGELRINDTKITTVPQTIAIGNIEELTFVPKEDFKGVASFNWRGKVGNTTEATLFTTNLIVYEEAPTGVTINILQNQTYTFKEKDFTEIFKELDAGTLNGITIVTRPESGKLKLNGTTITNAPKNIDLTEIEDMTFVPATDFTGTVSFEWRGKVGTTTIPLNYRTDIVVKELTVENITPISEEIATEKNTALKEDLEIEEDYPVKFVIEDYPTHGTIQNLNTTTGEYEYIPERNYAGTDQFTFRATIGEDFESEIGTIDIIIYDEDVIIPFRYEDMQSHWANYSASHLAAMNVIIGERINNEYFFYPDRLITRGDFVLYMLSTLGINYTDATTTFKFADDSQIESWLKPYVYTAYKKGIIKGSQDNGKIYFYPDREITRAEVATIINNAMKFKYQNTNTLTFTDKYNIPSWATEGIKNMVGYEIIKGFEDNLFKPNKTVTKAELAEIMFKAIKEKQLEIEAEETEETK